METNVNIDDISSNLDRLAEITDGYSIIIEPNSVRVVATIPESVITSCGIWVVDETWVRTAKNGATTLEKINSIVEEMISTTEIQIR